MSPKFIEKLQVIVATEPKRTKVYRYANKILVNNASERAKTALHKPKTLKSDYFPPIPKYIPEKGKSIISKLRKFLISLMP